MRKYWDNSVFLDNRAVKIFLNASGGQDDVSRELKAFQDYVAGVESEDDFVKRVAEAVREAKKNREWRHEYMTLLMRDQENIEKGIEDFPIHFFSSVHGLHGHIPAASRSP